jgi:hypothetical protein
MRLAYQPTVKRAIIRLFIASSRIIAQHTMMSQRWRGISPSSIRRIGRNRPKCSFSMSEGVQDEAGQPLAEALAGEAVERDAHGNLQLTRAVFG